jgi:hypothetical protein
MKDMCNKCRKIKRKVPSTVQSLVGQKAGGAELLSVYDQNRSLCVIIA